MKSPVFDRVHLDVASFAKAQASLAGALRVADLSRLAESTLAPADGDAGEATWSVQGLWTQPVGGRAETRLHLAVQATVRLACQRCLQPVAVDLVVDRKFRFVPGEDEAARLDAELEEDVLALPRLLDLHTLIEDELILALPIVPRHEACPHPIDLKAEATADFEDAKAQPVNPFAVLAALKVRQ